MNKLTSRHCLGALVLTAMLLNCGCVVHHGDFTVASTKLVRLNEFELEKASRAKNVEGDDISHIVFLFPTKANPTLKTAMDNAMDVGNGDVMTDVSIDFIHFYIPFLYGQTGWTVKGDVVKTRRN
jgi:hypothetical protein